MKKVFNINVIKKIKITLFKVNKKLLKKKIFFSH